MVNFITVRYVRLYEGSQPLRRCEQKAVIRGIGVVGAAGGSIIFHGQFFVRGRAAGLPTSSFIPTPRRSLLADPVDRVHAWHLSSEIPLFRRETNEKPTPPPTRSRSPRVLPLAPFPPRCLRARSRCFYPFLFLSASHLAATLSLLRALLFSRAT